MRIIGGQLKGLRIQAPQQLPVRPTTDLAKEALFNILYNQFDFESIRVMDLFSGTGNITLEFASRGVSEIVSVDRHAGCIRFLKSMLAKHHLEQVKTYQSDVFKFLALETDPFDLIFADPPYDLPQLGQIPQKVFERNLVKPSGFLIVEHPSMKKIDHPFFVEQRVYGSSSFSFFSPQ
ncbi:MAG: RsmD family RNA methyltransferase [Sphingobacteriaceae bacterium]